MRKKMVSIFLILLIFFIPMSAVTRAATTISPECSKTPTAPGCAQQIATVHAQNIAAAAATTTTISGYPFDNPQAPIGNYMFDSNGWQGNFDPVYWVANIIFLGTVGMMFFALNFYKIGASAHGLDYFFNIALKILHQGFIGMAVPLMPLAVLVLIGVFLWFGFIKKDLPAVFGRAIKMMAVFILIAMLASPSVINPKMVESIAQFPVTMGDTVGGLIEKLINSSWSSKTQVLGGNTEDQAWDGIVLNEWISGEEGKNYSADGTKVVPLTDKNAAWTQVLAQPLQGSNRNQVVGKLQHTPDGPTAFSSGSRIIIAAASFFGNLGPIIYFFAIGLILLGAKLAFIVLVAAGAVILPLELFPVTRSTALTLKWIQLMAMTLFVSFYLTVYSAFLFGLSNDVTTAIQNSGQFGGVLSSFFFLLQGVIYLVAIWLAWKIYQRMKPMQKIKSSIEKQAKRGGPLGFGQRLTAEARRSNPWETRKINRKSLDPNGSGGRGRARNSDLAKSALRKTAEGIRDAKALGRLDAAAKHHHDQYDADNQPKDEPIIVDESELRTNHQEWSETNFEPSNGDHTIENSSEPLLAIGNSLPNTEVKNTSGNHKQWDRTAKDSDDFHDDFFDDMPKSSDPPIIDSEEPTYHFAPTERVDAETKNNNSWKDVIPQKDKPKLKKGNDEATGKVSTIDKWETRVNKVANAVKMVSNPDEAIDTLMSATLGLAASKVVSAGKGAAFNYVRALARAKEMKNDKQPLPQKAKRQTDPKTKKATKKIDVTAPDQSFADAYHREMSTPQTDPSTAKPDTKTDAPPPQDQGGGDAKTDAPMDQGSGQAVAPPQKLDTKVHAQKEPARPTLTRKAPQVQPMPVMRMKDASVSLIKNVQARNQTRADRVKRVVRTTPVTLPKRPSLKPKKSSLADRIFGERR